MADILQMIRVETRPWHEAVERMVPVFSDRFSLADYERLLARFYGFYVRFEPSVYRIPGLQQVLPDLDERRKLPWLEADLLHFGYSKSDLERLPTCEFLEPLDSYVSAIGALYVTEGSTLGGRVICRQLAQTLELDPGRGAAFFNGHGEATGARWKTFTQALCGVATLTNERQIVDSAVETFKTFGAWLSHDHSIERSPERHEFSPRNPIF